ncbi:hypothetical protein RJ640_010697 [Escallonia rubra]|uniref:Uncharacterized protein n=1 Tax=Escallonia rubra TaxID=112253 RepID=A0AA88RD08_9ASTE|nr:hypothetical protein RJ640_010697 [Escallonia rubra]
MGKMNYTTIDFSHNMLEGDVSVLFDGDGIVRADVPFRRAESKYSVEQVGVTVEFYGGELNGVSYSDPATVKKLVLDPSSHSDTEL